MNLTEESNVFICLLCEGGLEIPAAEYKAHRERVHGLTDHRGRKRAVMHADAKDFFIWQYEWRNLDDDTLFATQTVTTPRRRGDRAHWEGSDK